MSSGDEDRGFKVTDRRVAADDESSKGEAAEVEPTEAESKPSEAESKPSEAESKPADAAGPSTDSAAHDAIPAPPADFNTLVLSLSTSALMHLGMIAGPDGQPSEKNLPLARHSIDLLSMLEKKTQGNLSGEEETLLSQVLYDLRMHFVAASKS